ncbi:MAG: YkvA family protein [bacterium]
MSVQKNNLTETQVEAIVLTQVVQQAKRKAGEYLRNPEKTKKLLAAVVEKAEQRRDKKGPLVEVWERLKALSRLLNAFVRKEYKEVPWQSLVLSSMALLYFVTPSDLFPDFIPVAGYIDDATIIAFVVNAIKADLDKFLEWEAEKSTL